MNERELKRKVAQMELKIKARKESIKRQEEELRRLRRLSSETPTATQTNKQPNEKKKTSKGAH